MRIQVYGNFDRYRYSRNTDSKQFIVTVLDQGTCGAKTVKVTDNNGTPLKYAYIYLYSEDGNHKTLKTDCESLVTVSGAFGEQKIAAYKQGYLPKEKDIYISILFRAAILIRLFLKTVNL